MITALFSLFPNVEFAVSYSVDDIIPNEFKCGQTCHFSDNCSKSTISFESIQLRIFYWYIVDIKLHFESIKTQVNIQLIIDAHSSMASSTNNHCISHIRNIKNQIKKKKYHQFNQRRQIVMKILRS